MKKAVFRIILGALGVALAVAGGAAARTEATRIQLTAPLTSAQEVPAPKGNVRAARGTFTATVTSAGTVTGWRLTFTGLSGRATAAHIHVAPRRRAGPVAVPLCAPCTSPATGRTTFDSSLLTALAAGRAYVNVHTAANPAGEIRGQVAVLARARTALNPSQEVPRPKGNVALARATFTATVTKEGSSGAVAWKLTFSRLTGAAVAAHIHVGERGKAGPVAVALCAPCRSGMSGRATVRAAALKALEAGRAYVNVHTARNPAGEVRGQIAALPLTLSAPAAGGGGDPPPDPPPYDPYP